LLSAGLDLDLRLGQIPRASSPTVRAETAFLPRHLGSTLLSSIRDAETYSGAIANQVVSGAFRALIFAPGLTLVARGFRRTARRPRWRILIGGSWGTSCSRSSSVLAGRLAGRPTFMASSCSVLHRLRVSGRGKEKPTGSSIP